ncbi:MAG: amidohydrolase family protein [Cyclobacteriaceae bacterium]|nr:amidohydrolase family protein [Cyclobacteriaceae bacterium]
MKTNQFFWLFSALLLVNGCNLPTPDPGPDFPTTEFADIVFYNGTVITMNEAYPEGQAIAIKGKKILGVGTTLQALTTANRDTKLYDLKGKTIMPGIVDAHTHVFNDRDRFGLDLNGAQELLFENGITTMGNLFCTEEFVAEMRAFEPNLKVKTSLFLTKTFPCGEIQDSWYHEYPTTRTPGEVLRINGVKITADGGSCGDMAVSEEFIPGTTGLGDLWHTQSEINEMVLEADKAGYQVAIHAIGDRAIEQAQNAIAYALDGRPNTLRHRIEHNSAIRPDLLPRYSEFGIIPVIFGWKKICDFYPRSPFYELADFPYRTLIDYDPDLPVAWHGDDPYRGPVNPFIELHSMVTRTEVSETGELCTPPAWLAAQTIPVATAIKLMTLNAAYSLFRETETGSLQAGKYADLIVISANPLSIDPRDIHDIEIQLTMANGEVVYNVPASGL